MNGIEARAELWPLLVIVVPPSVDLADVQQLEREVNALYARKERFASLIDLTRVRTIPSSAVRHALGDWQNRTIEWIRTYNVVTASALESAIARSAMTALSWIFRPPNEQVMVPDVETAFATCMSRLRAEGIAIPEPLLAIERHGATGTVTDMFGVRSVA